MSNFIYDIQLGFLAFPLVALLLAVPYALYQYRRFGAISIWKTFVVFTFILMRSFTDRVSVTSGPQRSG